MIKNPFAGFDFSNPFGTDAMKRSRNLFGVHTTPRDWKHGARDIPFGLGAASLYVDGTGGDDSNDGESWLTAKKTIQEAVDAADHWTNIFIKPGAYAEAVHIDTKHGISLIGATRSGVHITAPGGGDSYTSSAVSFADALNGYVVNLKLTGGDTYYGVYAGRSHLLRVENCYCYDCHSGIKLYDSDDVVIYNNLIDGINRDVGYHGGVYVDQLSSRCHISHNTVKNYTGFGAGGYLYGDECKFHDNTIESVMYGLYIHTSLNTATIFHNNLITCSTAYINDLSTDADVFENYYSAHSNVDNGFGIAKAPYAYTGGTDPRPICVRNGWLGLSWADADQVADILADVTGIAGAAMRGTNNAALASALTTHDGKLDTVDGIVDAILADTTGLNGDAMRGTNSAALASVCTETRLAELDAANLPADIDTLLARMCQHHEAAYAEFETTANALGTNIYYDTVANGATVLSVPITTTERCCIAVNAAVLGFDTLIPAHLEIERPVGTIRTTQEDEINSNALSMTHHAAWEVLDPGTYTYYLVNRSGAIMYVMGAWIKAIASDCVGT